MKGDRGLVAVGIVLEIAPDYNTTLKARRWRRPTRETETKKMGSPVYGLAGTLNCARSSDAVR